MRYHLGLAGDCAICSLDTRSFTADILDIGVRPTDIAIVDLDDRVLKSGRTTGVTRGIVSRVDEAKLEKLLAEYDPFTK